MDADCTFDPPRCLLVAPQTKQTNDQQTSIKQHKQPTNPVTDLAVEHGRRVHPEARHHRQEQHRVGRQGARVGPRTPRLLRLLIVGHRLAVAVAFSAAVERQEDAQCAGDEAYDPDVVVRDDGQPGILI